MKSSTLRHSALAILAALAAGAAFATDEPGATDPTDRSPSSSTSTPSSRDSMTGTTSDSQSGTMSPDTRQGAYDMDTTRADSRMGSQASSRQPPAWLDQEGPRVNGFFSYD